MRRLRSLTTLVLAAALAGPVFAGLALASGSSAPFGYTPDPALQTASVADLQSRVRDSCASTQAKIQASTPVAMARPCGCYASRVMKTLDSSEVAAYRQTGVFNEGARGKALAAIDQCKLKRPV